jgi:hypothetical protein
VEGRWSGLQWLEVDALQCIATVEDTDWLQWIATGCLTVGSHRNGHRWISGGGTGTLQWTVTGAEQWSGTGVDTGWPQCMALASSVDGHWDGAVVWHWGGLRLVSVYRTDIVSELPLGRGNDRSQIPVNERY